MSAAQDTRLRDAGSRYEGGFDRWNRNARPGWCLLWRASEHAVFALGDGNSVWRWDAKGGIWDRIPDGDAVIILQEHDAGMARLRRALPVIRLYMLIEAGGEREAARLALQRIGAAIVDLWQEARLSDGLPRGVGWLDSPATVYRATTRDCCLHLPASARIAFDPAIFAELVAADLEDLKTGRRQQIPLIRRDEPAEAPRDTGAPSWQRPEQNPFLYSQHRRTRAPAQPGAHTHAWQEARNAHIEVLRTDIRQDVSHADMAESRRRQLRHRIVLCGVAMGGLCTAAAIVTVTLVGIG